MKESFLIQSKLRHIICHWHVKHLNQKKKKKEREKKKGGDGETAVKVGTDNDLAGAF